MTDMRHMEFIEKVAIDDCDHLREKEHTYQGSWKKSGGRSAWHMIRRKIDRLLTMMARPPLVGDFSLADLDDVIGEDGTDCTVDASVVRYLRDSYVAEDVFAKIEERPGGEDGTVLAEIRDLRRYLLLVEAEMAARDVVAEPPKREIGAKLAKLFQQSLKSPLEQFVEKNSELVKRVCTERGFPGFSRESAVDRIEVVGNSMVVARADGTEEIMPLSGTLEDGGQHESMVPWVVLNSVLLDVSMPEVRAALDAAYVYCGQDNQKLASYLSRKEYEALRAATALPEPSVAGSVLSCYRAVGEWWVLDVGKAPLQERDRWPRFQREANAHEHRGMQLWVQSLYEWHETSAKWIIREENRAWEVQP